jgi:hypothetical protein
VNESPACAPTGLHPGMCTAKEAKIARTPSQSGDFGAVPARRNLYRWHVWDWTVFVSVALGGVYSRMRAPHNEERGADTTNAGV